jgi:hypothetical protein
MNANEIHVLTDGELDQATGGSIFEPIGQKIKAFHA